MDSMANNIIHLTACHSLHVNLATSTISRLASGSGMTVNRLSRGKRITTDRAERVLQWFSDHWSTDLDWPEGIPRPTPTPGLPVSLDDAG